MPKLDWTGLDDSTPPSDPSTLPNDQRPNDTRPDGEFWRGYDDCVPTNDTNLNSAS